MEVTFETFLDRYVSSSFLNWHWSLEFFSGDTRNGWPLIRNKIMLPSSERLPLPVNLCDLSIFSRKWSWKPVSLMIVRAPPMWSWSAKMVSFPLTRFWLPATVNIWSHCWQKFQLVTRWQFTLPSRPDQASEWSNQLFVMWKFPIMTKPILIR